LVAQKAGRKVLTMVAMTDSETDYHWAVHLAAAMAALTAAKLVAG
jgi:hypothetical protein